MSVKSPVAVKPALRVPVEVKGIQVNFCKNPKCSNFGVPVQQGSRLLKDVKRNKKPDPNYKMSSGGKGCPGYICKNCRETFQAKSNQAIASEYNLASNYLVASRQEPSCARPACENQGKGIHSNPHLHVKNGKTAAGSPRYLCRACRSTVTLSKKTVRQKDTHKNQYLFRLLMNKMPINRILEVMEMKPGMVYRRIDYFHKRCTEMIAEREQRLLDGTVHFDNMYLSTDRQVYHSNWRSKSSRKHIQFLGIGTADNKSGYVFPLTVNYDESVNPGVINFQAEKNGDRDQPSAFRSYAQYWLNDDYIRSLRVSKRATLEQREALELDFEHERQSKLVQLVHELEAKHNMVFDEADIVAIMSSLALNGDDMALLKDARVDRNNAEKADIIAEVSRYYRDLMQREDTEISERLTDSMQLPKEGMQAHAEYTQYAHFLLMSDFLKHTDKVRFFLDQESGIRAAFMSAFTDRIRGETADAWYVRYLKNLVIDQKIRATEETAARTPTSIMITKPGCITTRAYMG